LPLKYGNIAKDSTGIGKDVMKIETKRKLGFILLRVMAFLHVPLSTQSKISRFVRHEEDAIVS